MLHKEILKTFKRKGNLVFPDYKKYCLSNLPSTAIKILGGKTGRPVIPVKHKSEKLVFFLFDGFGFNQWAGFDHPVRRAFEKVGDVFPITTVFPSTTAAAMTSLHTGLTPQEHGLLEWYLYFKEIDMMIMTLPFASEFEPKRFKKSNADPKILLDAGTVYQKTKMRGIKPYVFIGKDIAKGAYSDLAFKGAVVVGYKNLNDLFNKLKRKILASGRAYYFVYWPEIDAFSHHKGPFAKEVLKRKIRLFNKLQAFFKNIDKETAEKTTILMSADHGQIGVDPSRTVYLNGYGWLEMALKKNENGRVIEPYGLPRDVFLQIKKEKIPEVKQKLEGLGYNVLLTKEAIKTGLFGIGRPSKRFLERAGDLLVLPKKNGMVWYKHNKKEVVNFLGIHGGLTKDEMVIPFAVANMHELSKKLKS